MVYGEVQGSDHMASGEGSLPHRHTPAMTERDFDFRFFLDI
jgi:hypothetical protein